MSRPVECLGRAEDDIRSIAGMIADDRPSAGRRFLSEIERAFELIAAFPEIGSPWQSPDKRLADMRCWLVPHFQKCVIFYRAENDAIRVYRVTYGGLDWEGRVDEMLP